MICCAWILRFLPVFAFFWMILTCVISFIIASSMDHLNRIWPYIGDTGNFDPERCYFSMMLNFEALLVGVIFFCRFMQVQDIMYSSCRKSIYSCRLLNIACLVFGIIAAIGISVVANFQETVNFPMHLVGAFMTFFIGTIYFILHTVICGQLNDGDKTGYVLNIIRAILCCFKIIAIVVTIWGAHMSLETVDAVGIALAMKLSSSDPNYNYRLLSTISEWILGFCWGLNMLTFCYDFKFLEFELTFYDTTLDPVEYL